jgi:hypothetical protein
VARDAERSAVGAVKRRRRRRLAGLIAAAELMTAAILLASPAHADGCYMPNYYGAIAWTPTTQNVHVTTNVGSQADADARAVGLCNREQKVSNCRIIVRLPVLAARRRPTPAPAEPEQPSGSELRCAARWWSPIP